MSSLSPFVYWAQNGQTLFLKVDLKDVKNPNLICEAKKLHFEARGVGAQGLQDYSFDLNLFGELKSNDIATIKVTDNNINIGLIKSENGWWPRLISTPQKPSWLKVDFDRWQTEEDMLEEKTNDVRDDYPDLYRQFQKEEIGYIKEEFKKVYLFIYNLFMFVGFSYILAVLTTRYAKEGEDFFSRTYSTIGKAMCFVQLLQGLEIMHPMFGYVRGGVLMPFMQVGGRLVVLFLMIDFEPRVQKMPVVFYLFFTWSVVEVIRYPFYITQLVKKEIAFLTWLRYTVWIVLYPIGFICESMLIFRNIIFVHNSRKWTLEMPNRFNFTFDYVFVLRVYLLFVVFPAMFFLMKHMYYARVKKLGGGREPFMRPLLKKPKKGGLFETLKYFIRASPIFGAVLAICFYFFIVW